FLAPSTASFAAFATRKRRTVLAEIFIGSPVRGFRPVRAFVLRRTSLPRPGNVNVFFDSLYAILASSSRNCADCFLVKPTFSAKDATIADFVIAFFAPALAAAIESVLLKV